MTPHRSADDAGSGPGEPVPPPSDDDRVLFEYSLPRHRLPNQHDLDSDDDEVIWAEGGAPWADFDDLEDAVFPPAGPDDERRPMAL